MAINAYIGLMGSGKSYEVVSQVILEAYRNGRTVVSNIDGLNEEEFKKYLKNEHQRKYGLLEKLVFKYKNKEVPEFDDTKFGKIIIVSDEEVKKGRFFPNDDRKDAIVPWGALVVIDEAWKIWGNEKEPLPDHLEFFTKHRHYVDENTKQSCDLAICVQDLGLVHKKLKVLIEQTTKTTKLKFIGAPKKYRIDIYQGNKQTKASLISQFYRSYKKDIFPLYHSYSGGVGQEKNIDNRINIFKSWGFILPILISIITLFFGLKYAWKYFHPEPKVPEISKNEKAPLKNENNSNITSSAGNVQNNIQNQEAQISEFRLLGIIDLQSKKFAIIEKDNRERLILLNDCFMRGYEMSCKLDGKTISFYTGEIKKGATNGMVKN